MLFNSTHFIVFFIAITLAYYSMGLKGRQWLLLVASCYFYAVFKPIYILILFATIVIDYAAGIYIEKAAGKKRKWWLIISLISNVGILAYFKYFNFLNFNFTQLLQRFSVENPISMLDMVLPIGLSFHTFQAMSYTIEVYRGKFTAERNFVVYALYVMFYPQLVAGPIERPQNVLPQLNTFHNYDWQNIKDGLIQMLWGLFKKVVIADRLAVLVDTVYDNPTQSGLAYLLAALAYSFQIYCDFSGYSDIALGAAKTMGYDLMVNFRSPYFSQSIGEFWRRWHISLSTWFRDYVYIPLGGNAFGVGRQAVAILVVFSISGLWHGASWAFVAWGMLHGLMIVTSNTSERLWPKFKLSFQSKLLNNTFHALITFTLVTLAWVLFRAGSFSKAKFIYYKIFSTNFSDILPQVYNKAEAYFAILVIIILLFKDAFLEKIEVKSNVKFILIAIVLLASSYFFGVYNQKQFIYFQF